MEVRTPRRSIARTIGKALWLAPLLLLLGGCGGGSGGGGKTPTGSTGITCVWGTHSWNQCDWGSS